ncbi:tRNA-Thr(GGU) m(6)t(6)A37 methyltransferase TsaA [Pseudodesulfovibrio profundus]|uniref:tRNA-Thr(GGU) m(6)t(6)A37 methyltransferase TsaA n=1 Tax=Pseudodesulfovibrio profundus TaxID=57320 RepID=A0A2C8F4V7_9BACT|nr:tRNA (N6-threonylcarbamoyladenosine(37)-N6)-methyltransferase TrmO [Pseudodesulfovibrio profundus]SOB57756.1 tRNA-Thr(GGU) m(6)t(6)A37 methyltransferase TsaA [Pseudodesulfovibrio profundus]|tara:strand:+ start:436 stop:849 length:414 start_codon:yes stop_codon:yes gene_type:complete
MDKELVIIGYVRSSIDNLEEAPKMEDEPGAVQATIELDPAYIDGLDQMEPGAELDIFTWLHKADRSVLKVHPRGIKDRPMRGVFTTRSPFRPNPIGVHRVTLKAIDNNSNLIVEPIEVIDGTPVVDIKSKPKEPPHS